MKTNLLGRKLKNRYLFPVLTVFSAIGVHAQISSFPWLETFEDDSPTRSAWTQVYETNNMSWTFASSASTGSVGVTAFGGTKFANFPATSSTADRTKLVSPPLNVSALNEPRVGFYIINPQQGANANWVRIYFRTSPTDSWNMMMGFQPPFNSWYFFGNMGFPQNVYQIAIECENAQGYSTLIDNFTITDGVLGTSEVDGSLKSSIKFYPNPASNILSYTGRERISQIDIFDASGRKVKTETVNSEKGDIDISSLNKGTYIVSGKTDKSIESFKIIKN
ncbi:Por secretion system C-terminal sorting domain-containing protein [Chryseobacterium arachidis]|uniref:Por secretion system C-terminal sorting domain-containing protein n=1 Tax=Chryseobacterium arachidis TaxID=1416778 RepID=A0A1M5EPZ5_9FLAO|nr:T9SS type A sorting domain-containing protein [Chryseobacterium arachidis]SHF81289.1 Por secretion system C-terminal sorting domain-containing protein [Chryseobacterium arachidis]